MALKPKKLTTEGLIDLTPGEIAARQAEETAWANRPARPNPQADLDAAIAAATTLAELKAALLGQGSGGKVAGKPV